MQAQIDEWSWVWVKNWSREPTEPAPGCLSYPSQHFLGNKKTRLGRDGCLWEVWVFSASAMVAFPLLCPIFLLLLYLKGCRSLWKQMENLLSFSARVCASIRNLWGGFLFCPSPGASLQSLENPQNTPQDFPNMWPLDSWCQRAGLPHCAWLSPDTRPGTSRLSFPQLEPLIYWPVNSRLV